MFACIGPQHRTVSGQALVVHEHAHQTSHIRHGLRPRGDRQPRLPGRLFQLFDTENGAGRQRGRSELLLRLVPTDKDVMDPRKYLTGCFTDQRRHLEQIMG